MNPTVDNILKVWQQATPEDKKELSWYHMAHTFCVGLAEKYGTTLEQAVAVLAVLSPRLKWDLNMRYADQYLRTGDCPTFFSVKAKLARIMAGEGIEDVTVKGPKVISFYHCILDPDHTESVVIDRHAWAVARGSSEDYNNAGPRDLDRKGGYEKIAGLYKEAATILGVRPHQVQAVTWVTWRRMKHA